MKNLVLCVDMYGCPNQCKHCWLGHIPHSRMEDGADEKIMEYFKPYFDRITFYSWLREPDFTNDYRKQWERDKQLSVNAKPERFELASFYRLYRDPSYVQFLKSVGVGEVQLTFFGMEELTDKYVGRKGAFHELITAANLFLDSGITPRYQAFINKETVDELTALFTFLKQNHEKRKKEEIPFKFFFHEGSCDGENRKLYNIRSSKADIPKALRPYHLSYDSLYSEKECCERLKEETSSYVYHNEDPLVLYITSDYSVYYNFTNLSKNWKIGNMKSEPAKSLAARIVREDTFALNEARKISLSELVKRYGNFDSERAFSLHDYKAYLLNCYIESLVQP